MCERKAAFERKPLFAQFWKTSPWNVEFLKQLRAANKLLKVFTFPQILAALNGPKGQKIYSLAPKSVVILIQDECEKDTGPIIEEPEAPKSFGRKPGKSKLEGL
jgi:hypothetical protein